MTDLAPLPVGGPDHEVWLLLRQVVDIGRHKKAWRSTDVRRIADRFLPEWEAPTGLPDPPQPVPAASHIQLTKIQTRVLKALVSHPHERQAEVARRLGMSPTAVNNAAHRIRAAFGARTTAEAVTLVRAGLVALDPPRNPRAGERRAA